jgi:hypothetical protein
VPVNFDYTCRKACRYLHGMGQWKKTWRMDPFSTFVKLEHYLIPKLDSSNQYAQKLVLKNKRHPVKKQRFSPTCCIHI